ncbi:MAG TPA: hypothetical protein VGL77_20335, partial [Armatimonadota bacterium]
GARTINQAQTVTTRSDTTAPVQIGRCFGGLYLTGMIQEIIIYSRVLSDTDRQRIERHLCAKWRVPYQGA